MTKAIVSSAWLLVKLRELKWGELYTFSFSKNFLSVGDVHIECECQQGPDIQVSYDSIETLKSVLRVVSERPVVIGFDDSRIYIKEMIM